MLLAKPYRQIEGIEGIYVYCPIVNGLKMHLLTTSVANQDEEDTFMKLFWITLGLLVVGFSAAEGDDFVNFSPRVQSPFFPSTGLLLEGSYANSNGNGSANTDGNAAIYARGLLPY